MKTKLTLALLAGTAMLAFTTPSQAATGADGFYLGGHIGGAWGEFNNDAGVIGPTGTGGGIMGGAQAGYNWYMGGFMFGPELDFSWIDVGAKNGANKFNEDWMLGLRARAGFQIDRFVPFLSAGVAWTNTESTTATGSKDDTRAGFTVGGGVDIHMQGNWSTRLEYLFVEVPEETVVVNGTNTKGGSDNHVLRVGFNYNF
jgi:outer membrane immunogenic protein